MIRRAPVPGLVYTGALLLGCLPALCLAEGHARLAVLASTGSVSEVRVLEVADGAHGPQLVTTARLDGPVTHAPDGVVRGAVVDGTSLAVVVTAEEGVGPGADRSFSGALWRVDAHGARRLLGGLAYASKPVVIGHKVFLQTGHAGRSPSPRELREDEVEITELDLDRDTRRVVLRMRGQLAYPIGVTGGASGDELVAYLVGPPGTAGDGGRLAVISLSTRSVRDLGAIGIARDFSLVEKVVAFERLGPSVVYEGREGHARAVYVIAVDGRPGGRARVTRGAARPLAPFVTAAGEIHLSGDGVSVERGASPSGLGLGQHYVADEPLPRLRVWNAGGELPIPARAGERLEPIGFVGAP